MRLLLDTCVLSEIRHPKGAAQVKDFVRNCRDSDLYLSVVTMGELCRGVSLFEHGPRRTALSRWLGQMEDRYGGRILPVDAGTARIWGEITAIRQKMGRPLPAADGLIAATALRHGLHVVTRNTPDFDGTGALLVNPWI